MLILLWIYELILKGWFRVQCSIALRRLRFDRVVLILGSNVQNDDAFNKMMQHGDSQNKDASEHCKLVFRDCTKRCRTKSFENTCPRHKIDIKCRK